ncbi:hypothetical protein [Streptosporangium lutulentum]|uniref:Secreted protein n=1 Tax=Streptosporangium lutulentum TaxID=1461250 RepID=A0ABT9Q4I5_9ACTN|nr:hypothetical protein [Streptosporangium lutulentum]MDP9841649.1 hypothetical protein [Streptosporangium lutulentum]
MSAMTAVAVEPFGLRWDGDSFEAGVLALGKELQRVPVDEVLAKANRVSKRKGAAGTGAFGPMSPKPVDWYCFDAGDNATREWYPQGLTCASDAGTGTGGSVFVVSWYHTPSSGAERGIRLSFLDTGSLRYRHVLLVTARADGNIVPINIHAGGVAWYEGLLYVADTTRGLRVFDLEHIYEIDGDDENTIGKKGGVHNAFGYRYVMPQTGAWISTGTARFSFAAIDRSTSPDTLISGEYVDTPGEFGRVARWPLTSAGSLRKGADGTAAALDAYRLPAARIQGALSYNGTWYLSQGAGSTKNGTLVVVGDTVKKRPYPVGPEDLTCVRDKKTVWSVSEFAGRRVVYGVPL